MKRTILLGVNAGLIYTGEFEIGRLSQGGKYFSASFNIGIGFDVDNIDDRAEDYFEELWNNSDDEGKLELLEDGDINREEAKEKFIDSIYDYRDIIDCSCTDYEVDNMPNGDTINFETGSCGQVDIREEPDFKGTVFTNKEAVFKLLEFWNNFHLKEITEAQEEEINNLLNELAPFEEWGTKFEDFIRNNIKY